MLFGTDKQTENDLHLFAQTKGDYSILDYYNQAATRGGRSELENLLRTPSNKLSEIAYRTSAISFIQTHKFHCNLDRRGLYAVDLYLSLNTPVLPDNLLKAAGAWIEHQLHTNNEYFLISQGIEHLGKHLQQLVASTEKLKNTVVPPFFQELAAAVEAISCLPDLGALLQPAAKKFSFRQLSRFDTLLRRQEKGSIGRLMKLTYQLDAFSSLAKMAISKGLAFAVLRESPRPFIKIEGIFHPFSKDPVVNTIALQENSNLCFVSGANMAGKSTFLKAAGLCIYLAHSGFPVPASAMEASVFSGLYSTINLSDDIDKGYSHYYSEVRRVKEIALMIKEKKRIFVIFDELFRGTNVKDAYDATLLITSGFTKLKNSLFFVSTHITEVCQALEEHPGISFRQFEARLEGEVPVYSYKLSPGISSERLGLAIVKNEKIMETIDAIALQEE